MKKKSAIKKVPISFKVDPTLLKDIELWIKKQEIRPSKTAVFEAAMRAWLLNQD